MELEIESDQPACFIFETSLDNDLSLHNISSLLIIFRLAR